MRKRMPFLFSDAAHKALDPHLLSSFVWSSRLEQLRIGYPLLYRVQVVVNIASAPSADRGSWGRAATANAIESRGEDVFGRRP